MPVRGIVARFQQRQKELKNEERDEKPKLLSVPCRTHAFQSKNVACLLGTKVRERFDDNLLLRIVSKSQPQLRLFVRAQRKVFAGDLEGISLLDEIAQQAKLSDKQVEIHDVPKDEARLEEVVIQVFDRYLSKRDIWHLHLRMLQGGGQVLYANFNHTLRQLVANSQFDRLVFPGGKPAISGFVDRTTQVSFKSVTANMFVLVQISSELWEYSVTGRPFWEALVDCFVQLVEKSLRVTRGSGHYLRMILFTRSRGVAQSEGSARLHVEQDTFAKPKNKPEPTDFYDVFWEGWARVLPASSELAARIRQVCMAMHEEFHGLRIAGSSTSRPRGGVDWSGVSAKSMKESSKGNIFECLNMVLDHFDRHYLDRMLRSTGQAIILLTAGNGLIEADTRLLYQLTHNRFALTKPVICHFVSVRSPPLHRVPWVTWPGNPFQVGRLMAEDLPCSPAWIQISFFPEVGFRPCQSGVSVIGSSLLPMMHSQRHAKAAPSWIPSWSEDVASRRPISSKGLQEDHQCARRITWTDKSLWDELRAPALRSFFNRALPETSMLSLPKGSLYTVSPSRFDSADAESEKIRALHDLVGLRLEVIPGAQLYEWDEKALEDNSTLRMARPPRVLAVEGPSDEEDMLIHGELVPTSLRRLVVRAAGTHWHFDPQTGEEPVAVHEEQEEEHQLMHPYNFYIRRHLVRQSQPSESRARATSDAAALRASSATWMQARVRFHTPAQPDWNRLDAVVAGGLRMPPALPYPVKAGPDGQRAQDPCIGWMLRSALKQNLFVLKPPGTWSHAQIFEQAVEQLQGNFDVGTDFFLVLQSSGKPVLPQSVRQETLQNFAAFKADLEELCFGRKDSSVRPPALSPRSSVSTDDGSGLDISEDPTGASFLVRRGCSTVYIRDTTLQTAFNGSRDWFELFYDDVFAPPKLFNFVIQWLVCSSTHMVHFVTSFTRIAEKHGFTLLRMPIAQLFPPPAPYWVFRNFSNDRETDFDRLAFYPRRKITLPQSSGGRTQLFTKLLRAWLAPPLDFHFVYATQNVAFEVEEVKVPLREKSHELFQRLKGWILCNADGLCLVALREDTAYWYENRLLLSDARDPGLHEEKLERIEVLRANFYEVTDNILAAEAPAKT